MMGTQHGHPPSTAARQEGTAITTGSSSRRPVPTDPGCLPRLDEHTVEIAADVADVWAALLQTVGADFARFSRYARLVGCTDSVAAGPRPLAAGSTIPGFRVLASTPESQLTLVGRHYFSSYALIFRLERGGAGRSLLKAESRAEFPGPAGGAYRLLVVRSGGHVVATRRLLAGVKHRAESSASERH